MGWVGLVVWLGSGGRGELEEVGYRVRSLILPPAPIRTVARLLGCVVCDRRVNHSISSFPCSAPGVLVRLLAVVRGVLGGWARRLGGLAGRPSG